MSEDTYQASVVNYFKGKASEYDRVDEHLYWRLSDQLLWSCLQRFALPSLGSSPRILASGGGTGRWTALLLTQLPDATSVIYDLSPDMTAVAYEKSVARGYADRLEIIVGDLADVGSVLDPGSFDLVINFHNVLGFVADPGDLLDQLVRALTVGGRICLLAPNVYHGVFFNLSIGNVPEAQRLLATERGRFTSAMPDMHFFTAEGLTARLQQAGADVDTVTGTPVFIYPGYAETQLRGSTARLDDVLADGESFAAILDLERSMLGRQ